MKDIKLQIQQTMKSGYDLAKETLKKEMNALLVLSDYLSDHSYIEKDNLQKLIQTHKVSNVEFLETNDAIYYRQHLKKTISKVKNKDTGVFEGLCLNRENKIE